MLFEEGGNYYQQSVVGYKYNNEKFYPYVKAYMDTPQVLYEKIISSEPKIKENFDELFLPMCYLFRNATELLLKQIMFEESSYGYQKALNKINKKKHKIEGLWNLIVNDIKEHANTNESDKTCEIAFEYIRQINDIDAKADKFRYPMDNKLKVYFLNGVYLDIENVYSFFMEILKFLDSVETMMSIQNEWKSEMEYEMHQLYGEDF